jgi:hypothetical protein
MGRPKGSKNKTVASEGTTAATEAPVSDDVEQVEELDAEEPVEVAVEAVEEPVESKKKHRRTAEEAFADLTERGRTPQQIRAIAAGRDDDKLMALATAAMAKIEKGA